MNEKYDPILVVDDEPEMCWILENIIRRDGFYLYDGHERQGSHGPDKKQ